MEFKSTITFDAKDQKEVKEKLLAVAKMNDSLEHDEFVGLAEFVESYPNTVSFIKTQLPNLKGKNGMQLIALAGPLIKGIRQAMEKDGYTTED